MVKTLTPKSRNQNKHQKKICLKAYGLESEKNLSIKQRRESL